jgi:hypothetical protein
MIAIDEDRSALHFRQAEFIKQLSRGAEHAISKAGKPTRARSGVDVRLDSAADERR